MATVFDDDEQLKAAFKSAIIEVLHERKDLIRDIIEEIIEDAAFSRAIDEGTDSRKVSRDDVFEVLKTTN